MGLFPPLGSARRWGWERLAASPGFSPACWRHLLKPDGSGERVQIPPGSLGKVSGGHFSTRTHAGHVPVPAKMRTRNSKAHKLTKNDYRVLATCVNSRQGENMPRKMGEMKVKIHFSPNFSCLCCSSMLAGLQMGLLYTKLLHWKRHAISQRLSSPWTSAFVSFSLLLTLSLSAGLKHDSPEDAGWKKFQADHRIPFSTVHDTTGLSFCFLCSYCV